MRTERSLCVEVVGARNLESHQSVDAYCVLQLRPAGRPGEAASLSSSSATAATLSLSRAFRSPTITASADPTWRFAAEFLAPEQPSHARLSVKLFNEKHFFFDMFPRTPNGVPKGELADGAQDDGRYILDAFTGPGAEAVSACYVDKRPELTLRRRRVPKKLSDDLATAGSESDDVLTHSEDEDDDDFDRSPSPLSSNLTDDVDLHESDEAQDESKESCEVYKSDDESIGSVEINMALLCKPSRVATDSWYMLRGVNSGEVRIRTIWVDGWMEPLTSAEREALFAQHITGVEPMRDQYGFAIPEQSKRLWTHLKSYNDCRERRRIDEWKSEFSDQLPEVIDRGRHNSSGSSAYTKVLQLARGGIPRFWRERVYMSVSGARQKQIDAGPDYYASLVEQTETLDTATFRQIELDIDRTFGHSGTTICTDSGRARLRRILRAYSLRNPDVGYCQGLNFIVGFLTLIAEEENAFWLLIVICEELFPGYYTPSMSDIQTDMLVLKQLIAEELPHLDEFTDDVGLPLELLGSQWLLCLFTTTFPSETVFRIFDCILTEGSHFVFPVIIAHLRRLEPILLELDDFHDVLAAIKGVENGCFDADEFIAAVSQEAERIRSTRVAELRLKHRDNVRDELQRAERVRALNKQLAIAYEIPAFSPYASSLLRFYEEAEGSSRSDVAFILTLLCHGLVWIAERSKSWTR